MSCLFNFSSHQQVQHMTSQILLILTAFLATSCSETTLLETVITFELAEILRNRKRGSLLIFAALSNSATKKTTFHLHFKSLKTQSSSMGKEF